MSKARIMPLKEGGFVGKYAETEGKTPWGFVRVSSSKTRFKNGIASVETRNALLRGPVAVLESIVAEGGMNKEVEGKIVVIECTENNIPASVKNEINQSAFNGTPAEREAEIMRHVKTAGKDGEVLTKDGERVLRFQLLTDDSSMEDVFVQHDNAIVGSSSKEAEELPKEMAE